MLKYLIKYDIKRMIKIPVYIGVGALIFSIITALFYINKNSVVLATFGGIFGSITYSLIASLLINAFFQILRIFVQNFYKDESYLTHTLPVSKTNLLLSKYLSALIVLFTSIIAALLCLFIVFYASGLMDIISISLSSSFGNFNLSSTGMVILTALVVFSQLCAITSFSFTSVVIAQNYNSKKMLKGLLWFALFYFGSMLVTTAVAFAGIAISGNINSLLTNSMPPSVFLSILLLSLIAYLVYAVAFSFICKRLFSKGVNVE